MKAQTFTTPSGETMVILPKADYDALLAAAEEAGDGAAIGRFRERMAAGEEELLPAAMVDRILAGESPIRVWRQHRGLSLKALAEKVEIAQPFLSQIETGKREGGIDTLKRIASALGVALDDLV
ncbi:helix-turn-helix transcriptional regulator [Azorhizobium caulinodans]|uniref:helix-turn-helix domain-containing protein n=1 Tax=Azorhizobium caulinodans TaxID=7 RepID=UPI002FBE721F